MSENTNPFGITREDVLELAATKLANEFSDVESLSGTVHQKVKTRIEEVVKLTLTTKIDEMLSAELEKLLSTDIVPVDIFGNRTGPPTNIRAALVERARVFWDTKVNEDGKVGDHYGSRPRHEWLFNKVVAEQFAVAIKQNITNMVGAFKDALGASSTKLVKEHIEALIKVKTNSF